MNNLSFEYCPYIIYLGFFHLSQLNLMLRIIWVKSSFVMFKLHFLLYESECLSIDARRFAFGYIYCYSSMKESNVFFFNQMYHICQNTQYRNGTNSILRDIFLKRKCHIRISWMKSFNCRLANNTLAAICWSPDTATVRYFDRFKLAYYKKKGFKTSKINKYLYD